MIERTEHARQILDLLVSRGERRLGFDIKRSDAPRLTPSMKSALDVLQLERLFVVQAGVGAWPLAERIEALPLGELFDARGGVALSGGAKSRRWRDGRTAKS
jgi:hypothetical protein